MLPTWLSVLISWAYPCQRRLHVVVAHQGRDVNRCTPAVRLGLR